MRNNKNKYKTRGKERRGARAMELKSECAKKYDLGMICVLICPFGVPACSELLLNPLLILIELILMEQSLNVDVLSSAFLFFSRSSFRIHVVDVWTPSFLSIHHCLAFEGCQIYIFFETVNKIIEF